MFTVQLNQQQLSVIQAALFETPYKLSAPVIEAIARQLEAANAEAEKNKDL